MTSDQLGRNITQCEPSMGVRLSRELIVAAATDVAVEQGTSKLSLRRLGAQLGVDHTALYRHFRSKAELLDSIADGLLEQRAEIPDAPWQTQMRVGIRHAVQRYDIHPELAQVMAMRPSSSTANARLMETGRAILGRAGLSDAQVDVILPVVEAWAVAFGLYRSMMRNEAREKGDSADVDDFDITFDAALEMFIISIDQYRPCQVQ